MARTSLRVLVASLFVALFGVLLAGFLPASSPLAPLLPAPETAGAQAGEPTNEWYGTIRYSASKSQSDPGWSETSRVNATFVTPVQGDSTIEFSVESDYRYSGSPGSPCYLSRVHNVGSLTGSRDAEGSPLLDVGVQPWSEGGYSAGFIIEGWGAGNSTTVRYVNKRTQYYEGTDCNSTETSSEILGFTFHSAPKPDETFTPRTPAVRDSVVLPLDGDLGGNFLSDLGYILPNTNDTGSGTYSWDVFRNANSLSDTEFLGGANPSEPNQCDTQGSAADPISTATGNFWETYTDLSVPGRGPALELSRTYNSLDTGRDGPFGRGWSSTYGMSLERDPEFDVVTIRQENGSTVAFAPTGGGAYAAPPRVRATLAKNADGTYTFTRNARETFVFDAAGKLKEVRDLNGYKTTLSYDADGKLARATDPAGRHIAFTHAGGRIATAADQTGRTVRYAYDASGNLASVTDAAGGVRKFTYDGAQRMLTKTDPRGGVVTNHYDAKGRVDWQTDPLGRKTLLTYGQTGTIVTDPEGNKRLDEYNTDGLRTSVTQGYGTASEATTRFDYDPDTLGCTRITDPNGGATTKEYDTRGNLLSVTDPLNRTTRYAYNALNDVTSVTDPKGVKTSLSYDAKGNLLSVSRPLTGTTQVQKTTYTYGDAAHPGDVTSVTDPLGKVWRYAYDANGALASETDPLGNKTTYTNDALGRVTAEVAPKGNAAGGTPSSYQTAYEYDALGRMTSVTDPLGRKVSLAYDPAGNPVSTTDAKGQVTRHTYDLAGQLTTVTRPDGTTKKTEYNADGTVGRQIDGKGAATTYGYDPLGRVTSAADPLGRTTRYGYDAAGNPSQMTAPGGTLVTNYSHDAAGQLTGISYSDGVTPSVTMAYDALGRRTSMTDGTGTSTWAYDSLGRLTSHKNGAGALVKYGHDLKGQIKNITYPGGMVVSRAYDAAGRMTRVTFPVGGVAKAAAFAYDPNGNLTSQNVPSSPAVKDAYTYSRSDALLSATSTRLSSTPVKLAGFTYTRDAGDLLASATQTLDGTTIPKETFAHDSLDRLSGVNTSRYGYDAADNLTAPPGATLAYDAAGQLTDLTQGTSVTKYGYDTSGNRTARTAPNGAVTKYGYDQANRLTSFGASATYKYNGDGLRMGKTVSGKATAFAWDVAQGLPLLLTEDTTNYVYGPGGTVIAQVGSAGALYYHRDQLGSVRMLTDGAGAVKATYTYDAHGKPTGKTGTVANPFGYAGEYTDAESGMQYLRARYYDPATAQFLSRDPLVAQTGEPYSYASNTPLNMTDPTGEFPVLLVPVAVRIGLVAMPILIAHVAHASIDDDKPLVPPVPPIPDLNNPPGRNPNPGEDPNKPGVGPGGKVDIPEVLTRNRTEFDPTPCERDVPGLADAIKKVDAGRS